MPNILVITFGRKSNDNQSLTLANKLCGDGKVYTKKILFNSFVKLPNFISRFLPPWITIKKSDNFFDVEDCDIIISCGRRTINYAKFLKKNNFPNAKLIQILSPNGAGNNGVDLFLYPEHDSNPSLSLNNSLNYKGSLFHSFSEDEIGQSFSYFQDKISKMKKPIIALSVGGSSKQFKYTREFAETFINSVCKIAENMNATLLVSTSRRTDNFIIEILRSKIKAPSLLFVFDPRSDVNAFLSFIHLSDFNIVTGDSISIISELSTLEKPLYVIKLNKSVHKYESFYKSATEDGNVRFLDDNVLTLEHFKTKNLNNIKELVSKIKEKLNIL